MAKISTYPIVATPATLLDLLIGTDVTNANATKNFEIGQVLSLYSSSSQKASLFSSVTQTAAAGTPALTTFSASPILTSGLTLVGTNTIEFTDGGYFIATATFSVFNSGAANLPFSCWFMYNGANFGGAHTDTVIAAGFSVVTISMMQLFAAGSTLQVAWINTSTDISLVAVPLTLTTPIVPSISLLISAV